jgi:4-hydroxy-tetrahydrodipicolinate synthase
MLQSLVFEGVFPILATPFDGDQNPDCESFARMIRFMADAGVQGVTILGVLGEANRLLDREREVLIGTAVDAADGRIPVIVGTSHSGTRAACDLSRMAQDLGASAVMVTPHAEAVPNEDRIFEYFSAIAASINIPIVAQDHPASSGAHMSVNLLLRLVRELPSIACIKEEALPTPPKIRAVIAGMTARKVPILTGLGALYGLFDLEAGSNGFNTGFAFPEALMAMHAAALAGDWNRVRDLYTRFLPLIVFEQQPGVAVRKEILRLRGLIATSVVRHPALNIPPATALQLMQLLDVTLPGQDLTRPIIEP